jgi:hypothetical protein
MEIPNNDTGPRSIQQVEKSLKPRITPNSRACQGYFANGASKEQRYDRKPVNIFRHVETEVRKRGNVLKIFLRAMGGPGSNYPPLCPPDNSNGALPIGLMLANVCRGGWLL